MPSIMILHDQFNGARYFDGVFVFTGDFVNLEVFCFIARFVAWKYFANVNTDNQTI